MANPAITKMIVSPASIALANDASKFTFPRGARVEFVGPSITTIQFTDNMVVLYGDAFTIACPFQLDKATSG
ncbi:MAG: hypothetical protein JWP29_3525 [Rhodoferax sp.]|nr:hypothetical protein [Rhodoferax sp.]